MSPSVCAVIPSWQSRGFLERCLPAVRRELGNADSVCVVDNGSSDGTRELLEEEGIPHIALPTNIGFAAAVNRGIASTSAPYVLVLNVDTELGRGSVAALADALEREPTLGGVQPRLIQAGTDPPRLYSAGQHLRRDGRAYELGAGELDGPAYATQRETFGVCGAACLLRRAMLDDTGGYAERFFAFYEDVELNARARILGWRFAYVPDATVTHVGNAVWRQAADDPAAFNTYLVARNRVATDLLTLAPRDIPRVLLAELGALTRAVRRRTLAPALRGRLAALWWLPSLLAERRALRARGDTALLRAWLE